MARGKLESPNLDDRSWQDIVDQARALIPVYAPEWTDHNPSDLGMTLIELFAWMVEGLIYRLNRVPEKNLIEFLRLIGVTRLPAQPASTYLNYQIDSKLPQLVIPKGSQVATLQTESQPGVVFETDADLEALPINLVNTLILDPPSKQYRNISQEISASPLKGSTIPLVPGKPVILAFGFDGASNKRLLTKWNILQPIKEKDAPHIAFQWLYSKEGSSPFAWVPVALDRNEDETKGLQQHGHIGLAIPSDWTGQNPKDWDFVAAPGVSKIEQQRFWLGVKIENTGPAPVALGIGHVLFNSISAHNALTIREPEILGKGNGKPFQFFDLKYTPIYRNTTSLDWYEHLQVEIREPQPDGSLGAWQLWQRVEDFSEGEGKYYRLNAITGTVDFGSFHPTSSPNGHGSIPSSGSEIRAGSYRYVGGGSEGNVAAATINVIRTPQIGVLKVTNPGNAKGGVDEESIEETKRRGPELLRNRYRAVTLEDYEYLTFEASPEVVKVRALAARQLPDGSPWTYANMARVPGSVHVIIVPNAPFATPRPIPTDRLRQYISDFLEKRRVIATSLYIVRPQYLPINVTVDIQVWNSAIRTGLLRNINEVRDDILNRIGRFLHPVHGGLDGKGWEIGQDITVSTLFEYIRPASNIGLISKLEITAESPEYVRPPFAVNNPTVWVQVEDFELICSGSDHRVKVNEVFNN